MYPSYDILDRVVANSFLPLIFSRLDAYFNVGGRMVFGTKPSKLALEETDTVCLEALSGILPLADTLCMRTAEDRDYLP
jgi:hypothetical protein